MEPRYFACSSWQMEPKLAFLGAAAVVKTSCYWWRGELSGDEAMISSQMKTLWNPAQDRRGKAYVRIWMSLASRAWPGAYASLTRETSKPGCTMESMQAVGGGLGSDIHVKAIWKRNKERNKAVWQYYMNKWRHDKLWAKIGFINIWTAKTAFLITNLLITGALVR